MKISERIGSTLEAWSQAWADRLGAWAGGFIAGGIEKILDILGQRMSPKLTPFIETLESFGEIPPELVPILEELKHPKGEVGAIFAQSLGSGLMGGALSRISEALFGTMGQVAAKAHPTLIPQAAQLIEGYLRGIVTPEDFKEAMLRNGWQEWYQDWFLELAQIRLDASTIAALWRRDKVKHEPLWQDLRESGWTEDRIEVAKELSFAMPTPQDVVMFMAREAFEPESIEKYGLADEFDKVDLSWFEKAGVKADVAKLYWMSHWQHPSLDKIFDLLHRGQITEDDVYNYYKLVEVPPYWRDKLTAVSWSVPTRIEQRMMARYGLVDKSFLVDMLGKVGLAEEYRSIAADMMLAMGISTDLSSRYSKGWLNSEGIKSELEASGMTPAVQERLYQWIVKNTQADRTTKERDLTITDIIKGVKKDTISRLQGKQLLIELGFDDAEATFKLAIEIPEEDIASVVAARQLSKTDILKLYKTGEIDKPEAISRLVGIRYSKGDAELLTKLTESTMTAIPDERQRELTKIDIVKGVKAGVIDNEEAYVMLLDIGYKPVDSQFILDVRVTAEVGSPDSVQEFRVMTQAYRASAGLPVDTVSQDMVLAARRLKAAEAAAAASKGLKLSSGRAGEIKRELTDAKQHYHQLSKAPEVEG